MYSHDRRGLGHTSRTLAIASSLAANVPDCNILVITDLSIIGRFKFPERVDFVRLPGIDQDAGDGLLMSSLNIDLEDALKIRRQMTQSAARNFKPNLIIIERDPASLRS